MEETLPVAGWTAHTLFSPRLGLGAPPTPKFNVDAALLIGQLAKFLPRRRPPHRQKQSQH